LAKQSQWIDFGQRSGLQVHPVSIGAMRLPQDDDEAVGLVRQAIDAGMIYIDTSRGYGESEIKLGKSLKDGYREKVILSTKWSPWITKIEADDNSSAECTYKRILESMKRLDVDYLDFYQVWNIDSFEHYQQAVAPGGMVDGIRRAMAEGLVKHTGFTTHDTPENVSRYIDEADWCEVILFTYNMMNPTYKDVLAKAHARGIGTIVMNPIAGGMLAEESPALQQATECDSVLKAACRYLAGDDNVDTILCGISKPTDINSTIANYDLEPMTAEQRNKVETAVKALSKESLGLCTSCKYCMPCPQGLKIPEIMHAIYLKRILQLPQAAVNHYRNVHNVETNMPPADCVKCGKCEAKCTQKLDIMKQMDYAATCFDASR
jgi:hypothetical protein